MNKELFSLYYINLEKVYELRMILNNVIQEQRVLENKLETNQHNSIDASLTAGIKGFISSGINSKATIDDLKSIRVSDTFTVKQTKSNMLSDILQISQTKTNLENAADGDLIRLDNLKLKLENEQLVRLFKVLSRDIVKGQVANGIDISKALNALAKDYSYLLSTELEDRQLIIKIPMSGEGEFENKYSIDDLLIGNVSIIGVYKGLVKGSSINSTFDFFVNLGNATNGQFVNEEEIQSSSDESDESTYNLSSPLKDSEDYIFIDLLAVVQNIKVHEDNSQNLSPKKKECFLKRLFRRRKNG